MNILNSLQFIGGEIKSNVVLAPHTSFNIGGPAKYFCVLQSEDKIAELIKVAEKNKIPYFILGGGSNILVSDSGFNGLVIKINDSKIKIKGDKMECRAGVLLGKVVGEALSAGLSGLEWAIGIPGTIGGAIHNNAGAFGGEMSNNVEEVIVIKNGKTKKINNKKCNFSYRNSIFKDEKNNDIILSVVLNLASGNKKDIKNKMDEIISKRKQKMDKYPSAGSIFRNVSLSKEEMNDFIEKHHNLPEVNIKQGIVPAAWLIEGCGLKGKTIGGAMVSEKHSGRIINIGEATAENVIMLISVIKQKVRSRFSLQLMEEIEYIGF